MADKIPVKAYYAGADVVALGEYNTGDTVPLLNGGTGATTASGARTNLGLGTAAVAPLARVCGTYLYRSGSDIALVPDTSNYVFVNGVLVPIPIAGLTLSPAGLSANTNYFIYLTNTPSLEASLTTYATDSTYGHKIKSGDPTRTLVGMARTVGGTAWGNDALNQRYLASWCNKKPRQLFSQAIAASTSNGSPTDIQAAWHINWVAFSGDVATVQYDIVVNHTIGAGGSSAGAQIGVETNGGSYSGITDMLVTSGGVGNWLNLSHGRTLGGADNEIGTTMLAYTTGGNTFQYAAAGSANGTVWS